MSVTVYYILMGVLLAMGAFLIVAVLMQHGKDHGLSGTIAGGAETFFGKDKGTRIDRMLGRLTTIVGIIFVVIVNVVYVVQPDYSSDYSNVELWQGNSSFWNAING
ncbi:MAG: preprotein translocase subunit SecG [Clostridia bacterium]|nr:preprotein translocase subunit SecG [Clostridia bacterium]